MDGYYAIALGGILWEADPAAAHNCLVRRFEVRVEPAAADHCWMAEAEVNECSGTALSPSAPFPVVVLAASPRARRCYETALRASAPSPAVTLVACLRAMHCDCQTETEM